MLVSRNTKQEQEHESKQAAFRCTRECMCCSRQLQGQRRPIAVREQVGQEGVRPDKVGQDKSRQDKAMRGKAMQDQATQNKATRDKAT